MKYSIATLLIFLTTATVFAKDSRVEIDSFPTRSSLLRSDEVFLRNTYSVELVFWLSINNEFWREFRLPVGTAARIREGSVHVAIATEVASNDGSEGPPPLPPTSVSVSPVTDGAWFYRTVPGESRAEFCWDNSSRRWRLSVFGEDYCT